MALDDAERWAHALALDARAFREIYERHRARVFGHALRLVADPHEADDVTAAVFLELWRRRAAVHVVDGSLLPWLLATATNVARNRLRSRWRYGRLLHSLPREEPADAESAAVARVELGERRRSLRRALSGLGDIDAALLALTALEGMPVTIAAEAVGISAGAARTRLSRTRARLRAQLTDAGGAP